MRIRHAPTIVFWSFFGGFVAVVFTLYGGIPLGCKAACDFGGCDAPDGVSCCNGDVNGDKSLDIADPVYLLAHLFAQGPAPVAIAAPSACGFTDEECSVLKDAIEDLDFGRSVAGTYYVEWVWHMAGTGTVTVSPYGTVVACSDNDFGRGEEGSYRFGLGLGTWCRTGEREAVVVFLSNKYDTETGAVIEQSKFTYTVTFDETFQRFEGTYQGEAYDPEQDPLTDEPARGPWCCYSINGRRLTCPEPNP